MCNTYSLLSEAFQASKLVLLAPILSLITNCIQWNSSPRWRGGLRCTVSSRGSYFSHIKNLQFHLEYRICLAWNKWWWVEKNGKFILIPKCKFTLVKHFAYKSCGKKFEFVTCFGVFCQQKVNIFIRSLKFWIFYLSWPAVI